MADGMGNEAQVRIISEQLAEAIIARVERGREGTLHGAPRTVELPAPIKWGAGIIASITTLAAGAALLWGFTTLNNVQITLARMDERQQRQESSSSSQYQDFSRRVSTLEAYHANGGGD